MDDLAKKTELIRKRIVQLSFNDDIFREADDIVRQKGMRLPNATKTLWREWLNDMVSIGSAAEFRHAASDPGAHFLKWVGERASMPYRVTNRAVRQLEQRYGSDFASSMALVVFNQEIAWAQRFRLSSNNFTAMKAGLFLRETEGDPSKVFLKLADIYSEAIMTAAYLNNSATELAPAKIRFDDNIPEFTPLFVRYANRAYAELIGKMDVEKVADLAARARQAETMERRRIATQRAVQRARVNPMRRTKAVLVAALRHAIGANELFLIEKTYLEGLVDGRETLLDPSNTTPHAAFILLLSDRSHRRKIMARALAPDEDAIPDMLEISNLGQAFIDRLPDGLTDGLNVSRYLTSWKEAIRSGQRAIPYDPASDFGHYLIDQSGR